VLDPADIVVSDGQRRNASMRICEAAHWFAGGVWTIVHIGFCEVASTIAIADGNDFVSALPIGFSRRQSTDMQVQVMIQMP
jgi:hypothetical protein